MLALFPRRNAAIAFRIGAPRMDGQLPNANRMLTCSTRKSFGKAPGLRPESVIYISGMQPGALGERFCVAERFVTGDRAVPSAARMKRKAILGDRHSHVGLVIASTNQI